MMKRNLTKAALTATAALGLVVLFAGPARADEFVISGAFDPANTFYSGPLNGGSFEGTYSITGLPIGPGNQVNLTSWDVFLIGPSVSVELTNGGGAVGMIDTLSDPSHTVLLFEDAIAAATNGSSGNFLELQFANGFDGNAPIIPFTAVCPGGIDCSFAGFGGNSDTTDSAVISGQSAAVPEPSSVVMLSLMLCGLAVGAKRFALHRS